MIIVITGPDISPNVTFIYFEDYNDQSSVLVQFTSQVRQLLHLHQIHSFTLLRFLTVIVKFPIQYHLQCIIHVILWIICQ